jgi:hypothetical protein
MEVMLGVGSGEGSTKFATFALLLMEFNNASV